MEHEMFLIYSYTLMTGGSRIIRWL